ncbi:MAG: Rid family detoxifying hydrolase, partial [Synergistaceae bacterium]
MKEIISTENAPAAIGPYSQAVKTGGFLFLSGQIPLDPKTMTVVPGCVQCQAEQALKNMKAVLESQGLDMSDVVKTTVFIKD